MTVTFITKIIRYIGTIILILPLLAVLPIFLIYRQYRQYKTRKNNKHRLKNGINILDFIKIGNIRQCISVRGENKENPILLILHGGPGFSMMPFSYIFQSLESIFTIVHWDQRGTGKTYSANPKLSSDTITKTQIQADTLELVNYLRHKFNKNKIFVLGHSWGSVLGLTLAHENPELLHAYIGVGQFLNTKLNEKIGYDNTLKAAYIKNNKKAINSLKISPHLETLF